jgi:hypothetical protein
MIFFSSQYILQNKMKQMSDRRIQWLVKALFEMIVFNRLNKSKHDLKMAMFTLHLANFLGVTWFAKSAPNMCSSTIF